MKQFLLFILLVSPLFTLAQDLPALPELPKDSTTNKVSYKQIVEVPGVSASDIYSRSREWFATAFKSANSVLQMDDKTAGKLIGRGVFTHNYEIYPSIGISDLITYTIGFTVNITIKEGKYRIVLNDYTLITSTSTMAGVPGTLENIYSNADALKKSKNKIQEQLYNNFVKLFKDVDADTKATLESLKVAASQKSKDDF